MAEVQRWGEVYLVAAVSTAALLLLTILTIIRSTGSRKSEERLPPGPRGWPVFGSILSLGTLPHEDLYNLSKRYGPIMSLRLGSVPAIVVTSPQAAEEVLKTHDQIMSSREQTVVSKLVFYEKDILFAPYGQYWRNARKLATSGLLTAARLNQFREIREREVLAGLHFLLEDTQRGNPVNMVELFLTIGANNITQMMMNKRFATFEAAGAKSTLNVSTFKEMLTLLGSFNISDFVPVLKPFDPQGFGRRAAAVRIKLDKLLEEIIEEHRQNHSTNTTKNYKQDFLDVLLGFGETVEHEDKVSEDTIKALLLDMLAAGGDTSSSVALWVLTEMIRHPDVMRRVKEELDFVVGPNRLVQEEDLQELKYLHAVIKETHRLHPVTPLLVPHVSTQDCEIQGFHVPAKTRVFMNVWGIHRDPAVWKQPLEFNPDRFLNSTVDVKGQDFVLIPFGSGRRMCPGALMASLMVIYPLALFLHAADFSLPGGERGEEVDVSARFGIVLAKKLPLNVYAKARLPNHVIYSADKQI